MRIIIQCAGTKQREGFFRTKEGRPIKFVAHPEMVPPDEASGLVLARPDDRAKDGRTWREHVVEYNGADANALGLWAAGSLYEPSAYEQLVKRFGNQQVFVLSAGWGLIRSTFLIPQYDITFSAAADPYKRRRRLDRYVDFRQVDNESPEPIVFLGGKDYLPLFCSLTSEVQAPRVVFYNSSFPPDAPGCRLKRFETTRRTNWHYDCAEALISSSLQLP